MEQLKQMVKTTKNKKLQLSSKKLGVSNIMLKRGLCAQAKEQRELHSHSPRVRPSPAASACTITGHAETKQLTEMLPSVSASMVPAV